MTIEWTRAALEDRERLLADAFALAIRNEDPQFFLAAEAPDLRIEAEGDALDGVATYRRGPVADSRLYTTTDGKFVLLYRRNGRRVEVERVWPSRSDWRPTGRAGFADECRRQARAVAAADARDRGLEEFLDASLADLPDEGSA